MNHKLKLQILQQQKLKCKNCGRIITLEANRLRDWKQILGYYPDNTVPSRARFHHLKMRKDGGLDSIENIVGLCGRCHSKAHNYYPRFRKVLKV